MEDALAAREVVLWCTQMPEALRDWGKDMREVEEKRLAIQREKNAQREGEGQKGQKESKRTGVQEESSKKGPRA
jgi:hypothetical protein